MGDRCYIDVIVRERDLPKVEAEFGHKAWEVAPVNGARGVVQAGFGEMNYGAIEAREALARAGLEFYGWHGAAADFGPCRFVAVGGRSLEIDALVDGTAAVPLTGIGEPEPKALGRVHEFLALEAEAKRALGVPLHRGRGTRRGGSP